MAVAGRRRAHGARARVAGLCEARVSQAIAALQTLTLTQPLVLLVLALVLPAAFLAARGRLSMSSPRLHTGVLVCRVAVVALIVLALARPTLRPAGHGRAVVFAVDVSDSVTPDQLVWA